MSKLHNGSRGFITGLPTKLIPWFYFLVVRVTTCICGRIVYFGEPSLITVQPIIVKSTLLYESAAPFRLCDKCRRLLSV